MESWLTSTYHAIRRVLSIMSRKEIFKVALMRLLMEMLGKVKSIERTRQMCKPGSGLGSTSAPKCDKGLHTFCSYFVSYRKQESGWSVQKEQNNTTKCCAHQTFPTALPMYNRPYHTGSCVHLEPSKLNHFHAADETRTNQRGRVLAHITWNRKEQMILVFQTSYNDNNKRRWTWEKCTDDSIKLLER